MKILIYSWLVILGMSACRLMAEEPEKIPTERITGLSAGMTLSEIQQSLRNDLRHEFTTQVGTNLFRCMQFLCVEPPASYYLLFNGSNLVRVITPPKFAYTNTLYRNTRAEKLLPVDPDSRIAATLLQPALSGEQIGQEMSVYAQRKAGQSKSSNVLPAFIITAPMWLALKPKISAEIAMVNKWQAQYHPMQISPGATVEEVHKKFGTPVSIIPRENHSRIELFGHRNPPNVPAAMPQALVAVVFDGDMATAILSGHFFSTAWYPLFDKKSP